MLYLGPRVQCRTYEQPLTLSYVVYTQRYRLLELLFFGFIRIRFNFGRPYDRSVPLPFGSPSLVMLRARRGGADSSMDGRFRLQ